MTAPHNFPVPVASDADVAAFIARHGKPYDPDTDSYQREAFVADIREGKNDPIYNAHSYHTKVPPRAIIPYLLHYTEPGDLVLDPFCGSGMTGVAAMMCAEPPEDLLDQFPELREHIGPRYAILNDLAPAACHIATNYCTPVAVDALRQEFERIKAAVKEEFDWLYGTEHYEPAIGLYAPTEPEVACRLKVLPPEVNFSEESQALWEPQRQTWELADRAEVERRLGYSVRKLPLAQRTDLAEGFDPGTVDCWVVIPATMQYTIWSDVYRCDGMVAVEEPTGKFSTRGKNAGRPLVRKRQLARGCQQLITLWNAAVNREAGTVSESFACPTCGQTWRKLQLKRAGEVAVETNYAFRSLQLKRGRGGVLRLQRLLTRKEREHLDVIAGRPIPYWYPNDLIDMGREMLQHGLQKRGSISTAEFFFKRQLWALGRLWKEFNSVSSPLRENLRFLFTSLHGRFSKRTKWHASRFGQAAMPNNLYVPSLMVENNILDLCTNKVPDLCALSRIKGAYHDRICVRQGCGTNLASLPDSSVDYVFTDPPFGQNIYYSDCSLLWEAWLQRYTDEAREIVVSERRAGGNFKTLAWTFAPFSEQEST